MYTHNQMDAQGNFIGNP